MHNQSPLSESSAKEMKEPDSRNLPFIIGEKNGPRHTLLFSSKQMTTKKSGLFKNALYSIDTTEYYETWLIQVFEIKHLQERQNVNCGKN